jgi:excisionase family DNA binding protein
MMDNQSGGALLTVGDVAELLRLTTKGIYAMVAARRIPFVRVSSRVRFNRADVRRWLDANRVDVLQKG